MNSKIILIIVLALLVFTGCSPVRNEAEATIPVTLIPNSNSTESDDSIVAEYPVAVISSNDGDLAYPAPASPQKEGYPSEQNIPAGVMSEAPNPSRSLSASSPELGATGGVLIQEITGAGFIPITPRTLYLASVLDNNQGEEALIARRIDSPKAELFPTGVFAFNGIQPGTYGLVIDLGFTEFPLLNEDGSELLLVIEAGEALDLGQVFVKMPNTP